MRIRPAIPKDIILCARNQKDSDSKRKKYSKKEELMIVKTLKKYIKNRDSEILVAEDNTGIIGHLVFTRDEWNNSIHIDLLFVQLDKQKQGIGSSLLNSVFNIAKSKNIRIIFLETSKADYNALMFYEKNGFSVAGQIKELYKETPGEALVLSKKMK